MMNASPRFRWREPGRQKPDELGLYMSHSECALVPPAQDETVGRGMRGLMARPDGSIIESRFIANLKKA